jgi:O-antigen/teichoic acid export membrane protein
MGQSVNRKIFHGVLSGVGLTVVTIVVSLVQLRLILDFLPKATAGTWLLFLSLGAYIAFFDLGVSPTLSREISFASGRVDSVGKTRDQDIADLLSTCFRIFLVLAFTVFFLGLVAGGAFLWAISPVESRTEVAISWIIFLSGASVNLLGGAALASLYGLGNVATERTVRLITQLVGLGLSYLFLSAGFGIAGMAVAWVVQNLLARAAATVALYRYHPWLKTVHGNARRELLRKLVGPSLKWAAISLGALLLLQTDKIIIATVLGPGAIPQYEAVTKIAFSLMAFSLLIVNTTTPFLSKAHAAGDAPQVRTILLRNVRVSTATLALFGSFVAVFGKEVIDIWLGPGNFVGFPVLWTLLVMILLEVHHSALAAGTMATGRLDFVWIAIAAGVLNISIALVLIRPLGLWGVALGAMIAQMLTNNWYAPVLTLRHFSLSGSTYVRSVIAPVLLMLFACLASNGLVGYLSDGKSTFLSLATAFFLAMAFGVVAFYLVILTPDERVAIRAGLAK